LFEAQSNLQEARSAAIEKEAREAVHAQARLNATIVASQEKAITKAEDAQREYNVRSNEFRGQLDDQNKMQLPRTEASSRFDAIDAKIEVARKETEKVVDSIRTDLFQLRDQVNKRANESGGQDVGKRNAREMIAWMIVVVVFLLALWDKLKG